MLSVQFYAERPITKEGFVMELIDLTRTLDPADRERLPEQRARSPR
ncbi:hypothetical protein ACFQ2K_52005 [Streptomyces sanglieri]|uniref:Uncharacterized protein n=1 Tax=Streptomyces sanglieri TaxID=193460 RepID=A0ABW2X963_9ACTN